MSAAAPAPSLPTFTHAGTIYLLSAAGDAPACEAWTIDATHRRLVNTRPYGPTSVLRRTVAFSIDGNTLVPGEVTREQQPPPPPRPPVTRWRVGPEGAQQYVDAGFGGYTSAQCSAADALEIHETAENFAVASGARWFRTADGCARAIAEHEPVATEWCALAYEPDPMLEPDESMRDTFERRLSRGGTMYAAVDGESCTQVRVRPGRIYGAFSLEGQLEWNEVDDEGVRRPARLGFQAERGGSFIVMLGDASPCSSTQSISYGREKVGLGDGLYVSETACRAAIRRDAARRTWLPRDAAQTAVKGTPNLGGC